MAGFGVRNSPFDAPAEPVFGTETHLAAVRATRFTGRGVVAAGLSGGAVQGRESPREHEPVGGSAADAYGDVAAGDGEAGRRAKYPLGEAPEDPAGVGHALEHGALDVHDLVAEPGEQ